MILPIYVYGSPELRRKTDAISADYPELAKLIAEMFETMYHAEGVGLAAPQVGKAIRLFIVDAAPMADEDEPELTYFKKVFINPEILERFGNKFSFREGCLSIPDVREDVVRESEIKIRYFDEHFNEHVEEFKGMAARIIQHEYDHVEGVLFTDHLSPLRKKLVKKKLSNIAEGKKGAFYKTKQ